MSDELGDLDQYIGPGRKLFPWEREYHGASVSGAPVRFHRDDINRLDGYVTLQRGNDHWVFRTDEFVAALKALGFEHGPSMDWSVSITNDTTEDVLVDELTVRRDGEVAVTVHRVGG